MNYSGFESYLVFAIFTLVGTGVLGIILFLSKILRAHSEPSEDKLTPYECGSLPIGIPWIQFRIRYYIFAFLLVIFDAGTLFLFIWALIFKDLGLIVFLEGIVLLCILLLGLIYAWRKGVLRWI